MLSKPLKKRFKLNVNTYTFAFLGLFLVLFVVFWGVWGQTTVCKKTSSFVDLARVQNPVPMRKALREDALMVIVGKDGTIFFNREKVRPEQLPSLIREGTNSGAEKKVYIQADARTKTGNVNEVVDAVRSVGIENIAFLVEERRTEAPTQSAGDIRAQ